jgi:hypothetical protein
VENGKERAARSVTRGQRDVSMDGRVNERLFVISGVAFMQFFFFFEGRGERRLRATGVGRRGRATFLFYTRNSV